MFELLRLLSWAVSRGGPPRTVPDRYGRLGLEYPLRPGNRLVMLAVFGVGVTLLARHLGELIRGHWHVMPWGWLLWSAGVGGVLLLVELRRVRVDEEGLNVRYPMGMAKRIGWEEFSHFERYRMQSSGIDLYYFRARPDPSTGQQTTITLSEMSYDLPGLVRELRTRIDLPEWPRNRKHWWGG